MSNTITPEERAIWASVAIARINAVTPERQCEITAQERLVKSLAALEAEEAQVVRLTAERDWLATQLACIQIAYDIDQKTRDWSTERWAEAARKSVAGEG